MSLSTFAMSALKADYGEQWKRRSPDSVNTHGSAQAVVTDGFGNIYVTGIVEVLPSYTYMSTIKYDRDGNVIWKNRHRGYNNSGAYAILLDDSLNVYVTGDANQTNGGPYYACTIKYNRDGAEQWVNVYNGILPYNGPHSIYMARDSRNNICVAGDGNVGGYIGGTAIIKYSPYGSVIWERTYETGSISLANANKKEMIVDKDDNVIITGPSSLPGFNSKLFVAKYDSAGTLIWDNIIRDDLAGAYTPYYLTTDADNNVLVTGDIETTPVRTVGFTAKYSAEGTRMWQKVYAYSPGNYVQNRGVRVAPDFAGNVIVGGICGTTNGYFVDCLTIKYSPAGDSLWVRRLHNGQANWTIDMTIDEMGCIYQTGLVTTATGASWGTFVYDPLGNQKAMMNFYDPLGEVQPNAISLDNCGSIVVTGCSYQAPSKSDMFTIKYGRTELASKISGTDFSVFRLGTNYPNPFNPSTRISYSVPSGIETNSKVKLVVYDVIGREVSVLVNQTLQPGNYEAVWNSANMPSGVYFYTLIAGDYKETRKMILLK